MLRQKKGPAFLRGASKSTFRNFGFLEFWRGPLDTSKRNDDGAAQAIRPAVCFTAHAEGANLIGFKLGQLNGFKFGEHKINLSLGDTSHPLSFV